MKKILLTGGNGFFCSRFNKKYHGIYEILSTDVDTLDITDRIKVLEVFKEFKPDYVIHAAAIANTNFCDNNPIIAHKANVLGALNVAVACLEMNTKMIFISTEQVFNGNPHSGPYTENHIPVPNTIYGKNKLEAELLLKELLDDLWILRFTWLFGLPEKDCGMSPNILWNTISSILEGKKNKTTCNEFRGLTYVYDILDQFEKIIGLPYGLYHVGSHNDLSRYEICCLIFKELGIEKRIPELLEKDEDLYNTNPRDVRLCTNKIKEYGLEFSDTSETIKRCLQEFKFKI